MILRVQFQLAMTNVSENACSWVLDRAMIADHVTVRYGNVLVYRKFRIISNNESSGQVLHDSTARNLRAGFDIPVSINVKISAVRII